MRESSEEDDTTGEEEDPNAGSASRKTPSKNPVNLGYKERSAGRNSSKRNSVDTSGESENDDSGDDDTSRTYQLAK
jgi:hypothetical protein